MHGGGISAKITGVFVVVVAFEMQWYLLFLLWVCGLWFTGNPGGPLSVPPVYPDGTLGRGHIARRWRRRLRGHTGLHAHMLLLTAIDGLSSCQGDSDNRDSHSSRDVFEACEQRHSLGFSLSPSQGLLLPSSPCSFVWVQEEADVSLAVCSPVPSARLSSSAFACENYLSRLPN